jgi:osmotically inducible lipoprotein OsmB
MKNRIQASIAVTLLALAAGGCAGLSRNENTAVGAVAGGVAGSALTGGSTAGTVGGAVVGGVIGHEAGRRY